MREILRTLRSAEMSGDDHRLGVGTGPGDQRREDVRAVVGQPGQHQSSTITTSPAPSWGVDADHGGLQDARTGCDCEVVEGDAEPVVSASVAMSQWQRRRFCTKARPAARSPCAADFPQVIQSPPTADQITTMVNQAAPINTHQTEILRWSTT
jgi:hypothetical protein